MTAWTQPIEGNHCNPFQKCINTLGRSLKSNLLPGLYRTGLQNWCFWKKSFPPKSLIMQHLSTSNSVLIINKYQEITFNISHRNLTKKKHFQDWLFPGNQNSSVGRELDWRLAFSKRKNPDPIFHKTPLWLMNEGERSFKSWSVSLSKSVSVFSLYPVTRAILLTMSFLSSLFNNLLGKASSFPPFDQIQIWTYTSNCPFSISTLISMLFNRIHFVWCIHS